MGLLGPSKEEEDALRQAAAAQQERQHGLSTATSDYESAVSHVSTDAEDAASVDAQANDTTIGHSDDTQSISTLQNKTQAQDVAASTSLTDKRSIYGPPVQEFDPEITASEGFDLALQRTITRKSLLEGKPIPEEEEGVNPREMDWDSPDDKDNPKNWSNTKRWAITMITASICLEVTFGSSLYVCGLPSLMAEMGISQTLGLSGLTFYLLGLAFGPALSAPMSELFGRRIVYISSLPISMLFTMGVGLSSHIRSVLVLRFFAGFFASPAMAVAGGTIADIWEFENMGIAMAGFCLAPFMGPVLGPVIGGFVAENKGWKWTMWVNIMFAGGILGPVLLTPETYKPVILKKRAIKRGLKIAKPQGTLWDFIKIIFFITLMTPVKMLFVEPIVMVWSIYIAFVFSVLFGFFEAYPVIFRGVYGMSLGVSGLTFLGILVGFVLGTALYIYIDRFIWFKKNPDGTRGKRDEQGKLIVDPPETRLLLAKIGAVALPAALFWLGWSSKTSVHWICPVIAGVPFGFGLVLIFFCTMIYFSMSYPPLSLASALAANNLLRYVLASVFPLFTVQMYERLHIDWASSLFAFIAVGMLPVPWVIERWGPALRLRSQYGYAAMMKKQEEENEKLAAKMDQEEPSGSSFEA
ncbi:MFS transporter [Cyberlindnera jadinii NRRL Y-1542]|uniref:MFS general substrate transporter n=1 Tax=Cyberlindnera jadinii (strain ATCC 18201 / CBS 1600 / BCRC 20928 / JCM 3617 / NBRC 0987 / NRRL Y-1542) TaxID=983966 RepID=A0A1E4S2Y4_CYBJN|nr:MFS general substrate transporter [Cyberlindnera jadinii NRRL Y-1542]ODV73886.1 MFS general substrate transporter [Cyberlindnera jadinii NRRL Y-1542]